MQHVHLFLPPHAACDSKVGCRRRMMPGARGASWLRRPDSNGKIARGLEFKAKSL